MPICLAPIVRMMCICDVLLNPKYTGHVYKVTVAVDNLGNIVWICDLMPGTSADVTIWDQRGPLRMQGQFFDYEVGNHDGAYKGYSDCNCIVVLYNTK